MIPYCWRRSPRLASPLSSSVKSTHLLRILVQSVTQDVWGSCFLYCFQKFTGYCVNTPNAWLRIDIVGGALALALMDRQVFEYQPCHSVRQRYFLI